MVVLNGGGAFAQEGGVIFGTVVDQQGAAVENAVIAVNRFDASSHIEVRTTADGHYSRSGLAPGVYTVSATKDHLGSEMFRVRVRDERRVNVTFLLEPGRHAPSWLTEAGDRDAFLRSFEDGVEASRAGRKSQAIDAFRQALEINPDCLECGFNLGITYTETGRLDEAERALRQVLALQPDYAAAYYGLSNVYTRLGRPDDARDARDEARRITLARLAEGRAQAQDAVERGVAFFNAGNRQDALRRFETATSLDAAYAPAQYWLGVTLAELGNGGRARDALRRALSIEPTGDFAEDARQRLAEIER